MSYDKQRLSNLLVVSGLPGNDLNQVIGSTVIIRMIVKEGEESKFFVSTIEGIQFIIVSHTAAYKRFRLTLNNAQLLYGEDVRFLEFSLFSEKGSRPPGEWSIWTSADGKLTPHDAELTLLE